MLKRTISILFIFWTFLYTLLRIKPELHFHAQQTPFFNGSFFLKHFSYYPGGMSLYASNYIMQFFNSGILGSVIIIALLLTISLLVYLIIKKTKLTSNIILLALPPTLGLLLFHNYHFQLVIIVNILCVTLFTYIIIIAKKYFTILFVILYPIVYYIFGSGTALTFAISSLLVSLPINRNKVIPISAILFLALSYPVISYYLLYNLSFKQAVIQFTPTVPITLLYEESILLYLFVFLLPIILITSFVIGRAYKILPFKNSIISNFAISTCLILLAVGVHKNFNTHKRNIVETDFNCYNGNYQKAIHIALNDEAYDFSINLNYNMAIKKTGRFLEKFFDYPQLLGDASIYPDKIKTPQFAMQISDFYYDLNYISKAQHKAYGILTLEPFNARAIKRVIETNTILGNYATAKTYLDYLSNNSLYNDFTNKYKELLNDTTKINEDIVLTKKRKLQPRNFAIPADITNRLIDLINQDSTNIDAYDHLNLCYLLRHDVENFIHYFKESSKYYDYIPNIYEQALLVYIYSSKSEQDLLEMISTKSKNEFSHFIKTMNNYSKDLDMAKQVLSDNNNTYMYYMTFLSPKVTNLTLKTQ